MDPTDALPHDATLLIYAPVPLHLRDGELLLEGQACNGLRLWAENFRRMIVMMPLDPGPAPADWQPISEVGPSLDRIEIHPLPMAYRPDRFFRHLPATRRRIRALIARSDYLGFSIGGLFGDWGSVSCFEAIRMKRPFYIWTDRVESEVVRRTADQGPWRQRLRARLSHRPMAWLERALIRRATVGLFHGRDTFESYAPYCRAPEVVHDIHISRSDHISEQALASKARLSTEGPLKICYVGRANPMKGPMDWLEALENLDAEGIDFEAVWLGDGENLEEMKARVLACGLSDRVKLPGFAASRADVLACLRAAQVFLFCHKTPESPRCLIEALISGCPIVGYASSFPAELIGGHGGGLLCPTGDVTALTSLLSSLARDRSALADLIGRAAMDGAPFDDASVFRHRSELIKRYLDPSPSHGLSAIAEISLP